MIEHEFKPNLYFEKDKTLKNIHTLSISLKISGFAIEAGASSIIF